MFKPYSDLLQTFGKESNQLLADRYQLITQVGRGAMGEVYKAIDKQSDNSVVAIKFLAQALLKEKMLRRFETEAKVSALLGEQSNHIVKVKDYGLINQQTPYYVMEYLEGEDLDHIIRKKTISIARFLYLTRQICMGLKCAHNGILVNGQLATIIHRDIKPSNIFLAKNEKKQVICKILDFGIAQIHDDEQGDSQQRFMGTPEYCSPEQMAEYELKPTSDIYSLGVLMYEILTKKTPIKAENKSFQAWFRAHHETMPKPLPTYIQLPENLENLIMRCLAKSPKDRPQNMAEILRVITPLEREYNVQKNNNDDYITKPNISKILKTEINSAKVKTVSQPLPLKQIYLQSSWPKDKPQQKIVFPCLTEAKEGTFSSLWTMLESTQVGVFTPKSTFCFNHFLFQLNPHPAILWVNLLYQHSHEPKWLPCYLDLKSEIGYQITNNLISRGKYNILLFELGDASGYKQMLSMDVSKQKISQMEKFILKSSSISGNNFVQSKKKLQLQFAKVKDTILGAIKKVKQ